jgi:hypothetical protein
MVVRRERPAQVEPSHEKPATTPEGREKQLIALAVDLAEKRLREGTASAQEVTHFLKLGSTREKLEQARLAEENKLLKAKTESLESAARMEELTVKAIEAMSIYQGNASSSKAENYAED